MVITANLLTIVYFLLVFSIVNIIATRNDIPFEALLIWADLLKPHLLQRFELFEFAVPQDAHLHIKIHP